MRAAAREDARHFRLCASDRALLRTAAHAACNSRVKPDVRNRGVRRYTHQGGEHENIRTIHQCMECRWNAHVRTVLDRTAGRRVASLARAGCGLGGIRSSVDAIPEGAGKRLIAGAAGAPGRGVMGRPGTLCNDAARRGLEGAKNHPSRRSCLARHAAFPAVVSRVTIGRKKNTRGCVTHPRV